MFIKPWNYVICQPGPFEHYVILGVMRSHLGGGELFSQSFI